MKDATLILVNLVIGCLAIIGAFVLGKAVLAASIEANGCYTFYGQKYCKPGICIDVIPDLKEAQDSAIPRNLIDDDLDRKIKR